MHFTSSCSRCRCDRLLLTTRSPFLDAVHQTADSERVVKISRCKVEESEFSRCKVEESELVLTTRLQNGGWSDLPWRAAHARSPEVVAEWLLACRDFMPCFNEQTRRALEQAIQCVELGSDHSSVLLKEFRRFRKERLFGDEKMELAERLDKRLNALFHLTAIGGARATKESEAQLFTENVNSPRNINVMSGDMFVVYDKHKNKKNRTPVLLVPSKRVGGMLFLHFNLIRPSYLLQKGTDPFRKLKWNRSFILLAHALREDAQVDVDVRVAERVRRNFKDVLLQCK